VPGYPPHPEFLQRLSTAASGAEASRYGPIVGNADLRRTYARHLASLYGAAVAPANVAVTAGCNLAFFTAAMLVAKAGDAVLLPVPWYFNHQMTLAMLGVEARPLPCAPAAGFVPDPAAAERLIDSRTRAIVLVTPNNPTGAIYPDDTLRAFGDLCRRRGLWLILDETYRDFLTAAGRPHSLFADEDWRRCVIQLYSFSKAYSIPGYRLGSIVADEGVVAQLAKILDCVQICAPRIGQGAVGWGIDALAAWREENRGAMHRRAEAFRRVLARSSGWRVDSIGAYFAYVRHPFAGASAEAVAERLAVERGVLALPGSYFGPSQDSHLRMAFGNIGLDAIERLAARLENFAL
jgi:aspartate/methionine/tyrosine aminotransferase